MKDGVLLGWAGGFTYGKEAESNGPHEFGDKDPWK